MYEGTWSPFDPQWYQKAFDKFISTADELFRRDKIIEAGYRVPDSDGSQSSVFRKDAILNNSFNEKILKETLRDIYNNSSHRLIASNHDEVGFYQWFGHMSDMTFIPNTNICEISIPTDSFIGPKEKNQYRLSSLFKRWIRVEDMLNHWEVFPWTCLVFLNQKIASEYMMHIDDTEVVIRFQYYDYWKKKDYPLYIYKFPTRAQSRILISRELVQNQWNWKVPLEYIPDKRILNSDRIMVAFNKISDPGIRMDGNENVEIIGDNLEFLKIKEDGIDLSDISDFNKAYILSELKEWLWMSIIVPKYFHEYPIILPTDVVYQPYVPYFKPVYVSDHDDRYHVKGNDITDTTKQIYVDINGKLHEKHKGWNMMVRPIVLSDAFDHPNEEPYGDLIEELNQMTEYCVTAAEKSEELRFFMLEFTTEEKFYRILHELDAALTQIHTALQSYMDDHSMDYDEEYEQKFEYYKKIYEQIDQTGSMSEYLHTDQKNWKNFYNILSPCIYLPREFINQYYANTVVYGMKKRDKVLWEDTEKFMNQIRFQRPIDVSDFWTFEYDLNDHVWRPSPLPLEYHFPDVYIPKLPKEETRDHIFKAFFFYADTMNVTNLSRDIVKPDINWDKLSEEYYFEQGAVYRDIFMEKFYWLGIRSIYQGFLKTTCRWEILEYVMDNPSYERFNELFLKTMDPYFKLGLATYLKSDHYNFPFDDVIDKLQETINSEFLGYKRVTNFEAYLNRSWVPSYFDYVTKIMDDFDYSSRLLRRPNNTFDMNRLLPILIKIQDDVFTCIRDLDQDMDLILEKLKSDDYDLNVEDLRKLKEFASSTRDNADMLLNFTRDLDLEIFSVDDINRMIDMMKNHFTSTERLNDHIRVVHDDVVAHNRWEIKKACQERISSLLLEIPYDITEISEIIQEFDIDAFMKSVNDLDTYLNAEKNNSMDQSLIGNVNHFESPWDTDVKEKRNILFVSTVKLHSMYDVNKSYSREEVDEFISIVDKVLNDIFNFNHSIRQFWVNTGNPKDQSILDRVDYAITFLSQLKENLNVYMRSRMKLLEKVETIYSLIAQILGDSTSPTEHRYSDQFHYYLENMISSLSYILGVNRKTEAVDHLQSTTNVHVEWIQFVNTEEWVFTRLMDLVQEPSGFISRLESNNEILYTMIAYLNRVNDPFYPDTKSPTYSDIYEVEEVELENGGFLHKVGDLVFAPKLGTYQITSVKNGIATAIEDKKYRTTSFRDPTSQSYSYDTITNGDGMGLTIIPKKVSHRVMINDEVLIPYITRVENAIYTLSQNILSANPYGNKELRILLNTVDTIYSDWGTMIKKYTNYMTPEMQDHVTSLLRMFTTLRQVSDPFISTRDQVNLRGYLTLYQQFIFDVYNYIERHQIQGRDFYYYDDLLREHYTNLSEFYHNGNTWTDATIMKDLITASKNPLYLMKTKVLDTIEKEEDLEKIYQSYEEILSTADSIFTAANQLPDLRLDIESLITRVRNQISDIPNDLRKDIWYKIKYVKIAVDGQNYQPGDIVQLVPELPTDSLGNPIKTLEDVILNDVILLQVSQVNDGKVMKCTPLMDYALPYQIWGLRNTINQIGRGSGLIVDIYSYEIQLSDSTVLSDKKTPYVPTFGENDMLLFHFENVYDLDIGYEVFLSGKQIQNVIQRHHGQEDPLLPKNIDTLYLNANEVMALQGTSITIPAEHYFVYKIHEIEILDPGAGYSVGQDVFVDTDQIALRMKVAKLVYGPTKGIEEIEYGSVNLRQDVGNISSDYARVSTDSMNNIDDEFHTGSYDRLTKNGIGKPSLRSDDEDFYFLSQRFDNLEDGDRNKTFMHPTMLIPPTGEASDGDPDDHTYLGSPSRTGQVWDRVVNTIPPTYPFLPDDLRLPPDQDPHGEYQEFRRMRIHNSIEETNTNVRKKFHRSIINEAMIEGDLVVSTYERLPRSTLDYPDARIGKKIIVEQDETHGGHRMLYTIHTFIAGRFINTDKELAEDAVVPGFFVYDLPEYADYRWDHLDVDWMDIDFYPDLPTLKAQYPDAPWDTSSYRDIQRLIRRGLIEQQVVPIKNKTSYIHEITVDDLLVFNWTKKEWEDLHDTSKWELTYRYDDTEKDYGFTLRYKEEGCYDYDMSFFFHRSPDNQIRNASLKKNAALKIQAALSREVNTPAVHLSTYTGRHLRIRKLFPYEQKESYVIGKSSNGDPLGYEMNFRLAPYLHFKNEIHLEDIKIYNKSAGRFENLLDSQLFEVRFKDPKSVQRGYETQTTITQSIINEPGDGFIDGEVWGWNDTYGIHLFGSVTTDLSGIGSIRTFTPRHCPNPPTENITLEFQIYQHVTQSVIHQASVVVTFQTERLEVYGDGYIHNVTNPLAPVPEEIKIICQYDLNYPAEYDVLISKRSRKWIISEGETMQSPTFHLGDCNIQQDHLYILTSEGRFPLINPSTGKPTMITLEGYHGTDVTFLNLYKRYERLEIHSVPYPMRSVYIQRRIPQSGFVDLKGKLNKPLNKKYFEFWVNGKLMYDEVTIISPTKLFFHGLTSLKNLEIIEVNRDPNEYFSDAFLEVSDVNGSPFRSWNYQTYLDDVLEGNLEDDNYTKEEQEYLLSPVWPQVDSSHPESRNYPPNVDVDQDILARTSEGDNVLGELEEPLYQFIISNGPTIEGYPLDSRNISFQHFGFRPIDDTTLIKMMNEEWAEEIENDPYFKEHTIMTDAEWYGMTVRLYDEFGILVHTLDEAAYKVIDSDILKINLNKKTTQIVRNSISYDLT